MRITAYIFIFGIFWWCFPVGASYGPMPPSTLITESEIIAVGGVELKGTQLTFAVDNVLKGNIKTSEINYLLFPEYVPNFERKVLLEKLAGTDLKRTIVLGRLSKDNNHSILLINSIFSIWPQGLDSIIGNISFEESKALIESVIHYESVKNDLDKLINELIFDIYRNNFVSVVEYSNNRLADDIGGGSRAIRKQILAVAFARFLARENNFQSPDNQVFLEISDSLPQTLAVPWLIDIAKSKTTSANTAFSKVVSNFRTRRFLSDKTVGIEQITSIYSEQREKFLDYDFKDALTMLNSDHEIIRDNSGVLLGKLLGLPEKSIAKELSTRKSIQELRDFWQKKFVTRSNP